MIKIKNTDKICELLKNGWMTAKEIQERLGTNANTTRGAIVHLRKEGKIESLRANGQVRYRSLDVAKVAV